jgi:signal transduction histidine kinase
VLSNVNNTPSNHPLLLIFDTSTPQNMKLRFKLVIISACLSLLAAFALQAYWLYQSFKTENKRIDADIIEVMEVSNLQEVIIRSDVLKKFSNSKTDSIQIEAKDNTAATNKEKGNSLNINFRSSKSLNVKDTSFNDNERLLENPRLFAEYLPKGMHNALDQLVPVNLKTYDSVFSKRLEDKNIKARYVIRIVNKTKGVIDSIASVNPPNSKGKTYQLPINVKEDTYYETRIVTNQLQMLQRMGKSLAASLLLIVILSISFIYLLSTIFRQKNIDEIKSDFVSNMTHELKTPIAIAYAATDAMLNFDTLDNKEKSREYLQHTKSQLVHLNGLVEQILTLSVEQRKNFKLNISEFNLNTVINNLIDQFKLKYNKPLIFNISPENTEIQINADKLHLSNAISNLFDNAIKYGKNEVEITINISQTDNYTEIKIKDNGPGIPASSLNKIFDKFYRVPTGNIHEVKGFGLGLNYVKSIMEKHGGSVNVTSREGYGSTFTLVLPTHITHHG